MEFICMHENNVVCVCGVIFLPVSIFLRKKVRTSEDINLNPFQSTEFRYQNRFCR